MRGSDLGLDDFNDGGVFHGAEVTKLITLAGNDLPHDTTHDLLWKGNQSQDRGKYNTTFWLDCPYLSGAGLGQVADEINLLGSSEGTNDFADLKGELLEEARLVVGVVLELTVNKRLGQPTVPPGSRIKRIRTA